MKPEIKWHGTASIEMKNQSGRILFDPFVPLRGSTVSVSIEDYEGINDIFITHGHLDHIVSIPALFQRNPNIRIHCTQTPYKTLVKKGIPESNLVQITFGSEMSVHNFKLKAYHGKHAILPGPSRQRISYMLNSPARGNLSFIIKENCLCREKGETVFYEIEAEGKRISLMGSLNLREEIDYPTGSDLLILPYSGWEDNYPPAVKSIERLKPKRILLDHYDDTFPPVTQPVDLSLILQKYEGRIKAMQLNQTEVI